ncbi:MAG: hypothetical protein AB1941_00830 [Gemmatimonadota bacterium]
MTRRGDPASPARSTGIDQPSAETTPPPGGFAALPRGLTTGLSAVPQPLHLMRDSGGGPVPGLNWSGPHDVPAIGARVVVTLNGFGPGVVTGYRIEEGNDACTIYYLALEVCVDAPPAWFADRFPGETRIAVSGLEFRPVPI